MESHVSTTYNISLILLLLLLLLCQMWVESIQYEKNA